MSQVSPLLKSLIASTDHAAHRRKRRLITLGIFSGAACAAALTAWASAISIEERSIAAVKTRLLEEGITWAQAEASGLQLRLTGTAPNEASRYRVINLVGTQIDSNRIRDEIEVTPYKAIEAPKFSLEMLRNDDGIQLIGLLPQGDDLETLKAVADGLDRDGVSDMIETAARRHEVNTLVAVREYEKGLESTGQQPPTGFF